MCCKFLDNLEFLLCVSVVCNIINSTLLQEINFKLNSKNGFRFCISQVCAFRYAVHTVPIAQNIYPKLLSFNYRLDARATYITENVLSLQSHCKYQHLHNCFRSCVAGVLNPGVPYCRRCMQVTAYMF